MINKKLKMFLKLSFIWIIMIYLENKYSFPSRTIFKLNSEQNASLKRLKVKKHKNILPIDIFVNKTKHSIEMSQMKNRSSFPNNRYQRKGVIHKDLQDLRQSSSGVGEMGSPVRNNHGINFNF